jgi:hypothetical protein
MLAESALEGGDMARTFRLALLLATLAALLYTIGAPAYHGG